MERGSEMQIKSRVVQLYIDVSTWSMVAILRFGRKSSQGAIVRIVTEICHEGRRNFRDQRTDMHKELCTLLVTNTRYSRLTICIVTNTGYSRLIIWISRLYIV